MNLTADDVNWTYGFNKVNQLTSKVISNAAYQWLPSFVKNNSYASNGLNQYTDIANNDMDYDLNGNLTSDGVWIYNYDTENMLLNASKPGASASYIYDPMGRRSAKTVDTVLTSFLNDGVEEIADYDGSGTLERRYVHGPGVDEYLVMYTGTGTSNKSYFHANHQGSIIAMSDSGGDVTEQHSYDSYGNSDDLTGNPFRYTGRRLDAETGLYYYRARYYSPAIGRFLQTDPIGYGDGLNWYAYVGNDPMNKTDPTGNAVFLIPLVIFIAKEIAGEAFEQATGLPAPTVKGIGKAVGKRILKNKARKQLAKNKVASKKGEAQTRKNLGNNIKGEQVSFKTSNGKNAKPDFVTKDNKIVESKNGDANLSSNQKQLFKMLRMARR